MDSGVLITDFSRALRAEEILPPGAAFEVLDFTSLEGARSYCDEAAEAEIAGRISPFRFPGEKWREFPVHLIDTGEYHYMSKLFTDSIDIPYTLLMIDNHTDLQEPAFGGILSCGGWLREAMLTSGTLRQVLLAGPEGRIALYRRSGAFPVGASGVFPGTVGEFALVAEAPLSADGLGQIYTNDLGDAMYISIDKDIMSEESYLTDWSQGALSLAELQSLLFTIIHPLFGGVTLATCVTNGFATRGASPSDSASWLAPRLLGIDICGGLSPQHPALTCDTSLNRHTDLALLSSLLG